MFPTIDVYSELSPIRLYPCWVKQETRPPAYAGGRVCDVESIEGFGRLFFRAYIAAITHDAMGSDDEGVTQSGNVYVKPFGTRSLIIEFSRNRILQFIIFFIVCSWNSIRVISDMEMVFRHFRPFAVADAIGLKEFSTIIKTM